MANNLDISNVVSVAEAATPAGLGPFNTGNIAYFTHEAYGESFGNDPYKIYLNASEVAADFGSDSITADMASANFSQAPNNLTAGGYLAVIPLIPAAVKITFSAVPDSGNFSFYYGTDTSKTSGDIAYNATASAVQTAARTIPALAKAVVTGDFENGFVISTPGDVSPSLTISASTLKQSTDDVTATFTSQGIESIGAAITRTKPLLQYVHTLTTRILSQDELINSAAPAIQPEYKMGYFPGTDVADIEVGGKLDLLRSGSFSKTRGLYYGLSERGALLYAAAYASRGASVNFSGSNTTITMNLKDLAGVPVDTTITQTIKNKAEAAGADIYCSIEGLSKVLSFGANQYYDQVFNKIWFLKKIQIDCFNYLAMTSSKIPQTEAGADGFDNVCRKVCAQAIINGFGAPGEWTIADTFGDPETFKRNINELGYYVYHTPLANQSAAERQSRKLPLCQVALKEAGAVHSASILVYVNP